MPKFKSRENKDPIWHAKRESKARSVRAQPLEGTSQVEKLLKLMQSDSSPAQKVAVVNSRPSYLALENIVLTPSQLIFSSPSQGPRTKHVKTPNGTMLIPARTVTFDDGETTLFLSPNKVSDKALLLPTPNAWLSSSPVPQVDQSGLIDVALTLDMIKSIEKLKRQRTQLGQNLRGQSQNNIMGISATQALALAGIEAPERTGQWLHFGPHSILGDSGQCATNLGLGTRFANAAMELVNPVIKSLLLQYKHNLPALYLSAIPEWAPGFERIRLLKSITYVLKDGPTGSFTRSASLKFNTLSLNRVCLSEIKPIRQAILNKFAHPNPQVLPSQKREVPESPSLKYMRARYAPS